VGPRASLSVKEKRKILSPTRNGTQFSGRPACSLVAVPTELPQLLNTFE
jgi:hypothetical protein